MDYDFSILEQNGISVKDGLSYTGTKEKYVSALQRFFKGYEANAESVKSFLDTGDIENYTIKVHALKSNSRMIGAEELAAVFEKLEYSGKSGDAETVKHNTPVALKLYGEMIELIRPFGEMEQVRVEGELSADEARKVAEELLAALDDFDDEKSLALASKLKGYPFRITQKSKLNEAADLIGDFMYDEAAEIVKEILPAIE